MEDGAPSRGNLQVAVFFLADFLCGGKGLDGSRQREMRPDGRLRQILDGISVLTGWVQPLTEHTEARKALILMVMLKVIWSTEAEPTIEPIASPPRLGLRPPQEASHLQQTKWGGGGES